MNWTVDLNWVTLSPVLFLEMQMLLQIILVKSKENQVKRAGMFDILLYKNHYILYF